MSLPTATIRWTYTPGRWISSGSSSPGWTSSSTWAMVIRPAIAASGLKFRALRSNTRLPWVSPFSACTSPKSVVIDSSSTYVVPPISRVSFGSDAFATEPSALYFCGSPPSATWVPTPASVKKAAIPHPPARSFSASVPCGVSSTSSSPDRNCRANSLFSPTYDEVILAIRLSASRMPSPHSSTPQLFETTLRSLTPLSWIALINCIGLPHSPKPPTARLAPSEMSSTAACGESYVLSIRLLRGCGHGVSPTLTSRRKSGESPHVCPPPQLVLRVRRPLRARNRGGLDRRELVLSLFPCLRKIPRTPGQRRLGVLPGCRQIPGVPGNPREADSRGSGRLEEPHTFCDEQCAAVVVPCGLQIALPPVEVSTAAQDQRGVLGQLKFTGERQRLADQFQWHLSHFCHRGENQERPPLVAEHPEPGERCLQSSSLLARVTA